LRADAATDPAAGYATKLERVAIAGVEDLLIRSLLDRQQFADPEGDAARLGISSAAWPLFGVLWPSAILLAERLVGRAVTPTERILELGCGLGLASLAAHRRGADITASDRHPLAEQFLLANLQANHLPPLKYRQGNWGVPPTTAPRAGLPVVRALTGTFDLIVGSDVLYERDANAELAGFIARHAAAGAEIWIVDPNRGNRPAFNRQMARHGFSVREERLVHPASATLVACSGRLLTYRKMEPTATLA
jgi:predicted nicotinamide N-methyase